MRASVTESERFESSDKLLEALHPANERWEPDPRAWIFRGHADAEWLIIPTAYRPECWKGLADVDNEPGPMHGADGVFRRAERDVLVKFFEGLDNAGIAIPGDGEDLRHDMRAPGSPNRPRHGLMTFMAYARHAGLPTRLLDWSRRSRVAAYFAAVEAARMGSNGPNDQLSVIAFRPEPVCTLSVSTESRIVLVHAPQASNPNLNAQSGVCTLWSSPMPGAPIDAAADEVKQARANMQASVPFPLFRRMTMPRSEAGRLLRLLAHEGITGASMFPGPDGVIKAMREEALWHGP